MEEVWKDITLPNLHRYPPSSSSSPPPPHPLNHHQIPAATPFHGLILRDFLAGAFKDPHHCHHSPESFDRRLPLPTLSLACGGLPSPFLPRKRASEQPPDPSCTAGSSDDRRKKRLMKNRETAARSRARKQAYTNELETEIAHLAQENASLKRQHHALKKAMAAAQPPIKCELQRASSF